MGKKIFELFAGTESVLVVVSLQKAYRIEFEKRRRKQKKELYKKCMRQMRTKYVWIFYVCLVFGVWLSLLFYSCFVLHFNDSHSSLRGCGLYVASSFIQFFFSFYIFISFRIHLFLFNNFNGL